MTKIITMMIIACLITTPSFATIWSPFHVYSSNDTVTNTNLNGNYNSLGNIINGGIDNSNINTLLGYRLPQTVGSLPSFGNQGAIYFLTSGNTLNIDTGSSFIQTLTIPSSSVQGNILYYGPSGWTILAPGTAGLPLTTGGSNANPSWSILTSAAGGTGSNLGGSVQGSVPYFSATGVMSALGTGTAGQVLQTQGASANPIWANGLSAVADYGASQSSSTSRQATSLKFAYGQTGSIGGSSSVNVTGLSFATGTSYTVTTGQYSGFNCAISGKTANQFTITNTHGDNSGGNGNCDWMAIGT